MTRDEARALIADEPVVPVRVLRQWIEQRQAEIRSWMGSPDIGPLDYERACSHLAVVSEVSRVLDDYEKENPNG